MFVSIPVIAILCFCLLHEQIWKVFVMFEEKKTLGTILKQTNAKSQKSICKAKHRKNSTENCYTKSLMN